MRRSVDILAVYVHRQYLQWLSWRAFLVTIVLEQMIAPLLGLAVWTTALPGDSSITTYYIAILVVQLATVSFESHTLSNVIYSGDLSQELLRPHAVVLSVLGTNLAMRILHLFAGVPLVLLLLVFSDASFSAQSLALAIPAVLVAASLRFLYTFSIACTAFWTQQAEASVNFGTTLVFLLGGIAAPTFILSDQLKFWLELLPFRSMMGFPADLASSEVSVSEALIGFGLQGAWLGVFAGVAVLVWNKGVRRYTAVGG